MPAAAARTSAQVYRRSLVCHFARLERARFSYSCGVDRPPSVDALARSLADTGLPHPLCVDVAREAIAAGDHQQARERANAMARRLLQPVINATGVLLHTNMGRAPWPADVAAGYTNLELDLESGQRGSRQDHVGRLFARLVGAEAAIVVNNCASAVLLVLGAVAAGRSVAVSRSELVEIGGGFRVPEVMAQSGAKLVEVGTTNRTRRADFERARDTTDDLALVMKVHQSNYKIVGFTETADVPELTDLGVPLAADIGSGLLDAACPWLPGGPPAWLADEPAAAQTLTAGADLVTFSPATSSLAAPRPGSSPVRPSWSANVRVTRWLERCGPGGWCCRRCKRSLSPTSDGTVWPSPSGAWPPCRQRRCMHAQPRCTATPVSAR